MFCTQCGEKVSDSSHFCSHCGHQVCAPSPSAVSEEVPSAEQYADINIETTPEAAVSTSTEKKGRLWPPVLILVILFGVGLFLFLCLRPSVAVTDLAMPWFAVADGTLYFNEQLYVGGSELEVPAVVAGEQVTAISDECFKNCHRFIAIILPDGIEQIGSRAFAGCTSLRGLLIPETVTTLGSELFSSCGKLEAVCIPYTVVTAGADLFYGCEKLHHIFYPGPIESWKLLEINITGLNTHVYCYDGTILPG